MSPLSNPYNQSCATNNGVKPQLTEEPEVGAESQLPAVEPLRLLKGFAGERWLTGSGVWQVPLQSNGKRASSVSPVRCQMSVKRKGGGRGLQHHWSGGRRHISWEQTRRVNSDTSEEECHGLAAGTLGFAPTALKVLSGLAQSQVCTVSAGLGANSVWWSAEKDHGKAAPPKKNEKINHFLRKRLLMLSNKWTGGKLCGLCLNERPCLSVCLFTSSKVFSSCPCVIVTLTPGALHSTCFRPLLANANVCPVHRDGTRKVAINVSITGGMGWEQAVRLIQKSKSKNYPQQLLCVRGFW